MLTYCFSGEPLHNICYYLYEQCAYYLENGKNNISIIQEILQPNKHFLNITLDDDGSFVYIGERFNPNDSLVDIIKKLYPLPLNPGEIYFKNKRNPYHKAIKMFKHLLKEKKIKNCRAIVFNELTKLTINAVNLIENIQYLNDYAKNSTNKTILAEIEKVIFYIKQFNYSLKKCVKGQMRNEFFIGIGKPYHFF